MLRDGTGRRCGFGDGDVAKVSIPWSRQAGCEVSATRSSRAGPLGPADRAKILSAPGKHESAVAETAEDTNCLRDKLCFNVIVVFSLPATQACKAHIITQQSCQRSERYIRQAVPNLCWAT